MIKLIPHRNISKRDLFKAVESGRKFGVFKGDESAYMPEIHWDDNYGNNPVRCGTKPWNWRGFKYLHEITESHWYDNIQSPGAPCRVWDDHPELFHIALIVSGHVDSYFVDSYGVAHDNAEPLTAEHLYQEPV